MICITVVFDLDTWCSKIKISHVFKKLWCFAQFLLVQSKKVLLKSYFAWRIFLHMTGPHDSCRRCSSNLRQLEQIFRRNIVENQYECFVYTWYVIFREGLWIIKDEVIFVSDLGGKKYLFIQMIQDHFLCSSIFKIFHTWSSYFDFKINFYNTLCWYSGKDTGLSPERPQFKSLHYQAFLQKAFPWKFFKKWLSPRRIMIWPLKRGEIIRNPPLD